MRRYLKFVGLVGAVALIAACGGLTGSSGTGGSETGASGTGTGSTVSAVGLQVTVTAPIQSSLSLPKALHAMGINIKSVGIAQDEAVGVTCHCEDLSGNIIGEPCDTGSDGACEITGLTETQILAGVVLVAETPEGDLNAYVEPTQAQYDAAKTAGTPIKEDCNAETDVAHAIIRDECNDDIANCQKTIDPLCIKEAVVAVVGDSAVSSNDMGGYCEGMLKAHAGAYLATGSTNPADLMKTALGGDATAVTNVAGTSIESVPVADAITNCKTMVTKIKESFCTRADASSKAPWKEVKDKAGSDFDPRALAGVVEGFTPSEIGSYAVDDLKNFAIAMPDLTGGFATFGNHEEARRSAVEQFRLGNFRGADTAKAGAALGFLAATFPPPPTSGNYAGISFTGFDPDVAAQAASNGYYEYKDSVGSTGTYANPGDIYTKFNSTLSDASNRQAWAIGGSSACAGFIDGFVAVGPANFNPIDYAGTIKSAPGEGCTKDSDCIYGTACANGLCTALSAKLGLGCNTSSDCGSDGTLDCVGAYMAGQGGRCIAKAAVPVGAYVPPATSGATAIAYGGTGGYTPPPSGTTGSLCGSGQPACQPGLTCSSADLGTCLPSDFQRSAYAPCTVNSECGSGSCVTGQCAVTQAYITAQTGSTTTGTTAGARLVGQTCATGNECATFYCTAGLCAAPPTTYQAAVGTSSLNDNGASCTTSAFCKSSYCDISSLTCKDTPTSTTTTTTTTGTTTGTTTTTMSLPTGSPCSEHMNCASMICEYTSPRVCR